MHRLQEAGLRLKPRKCQFVRTRVTFLGHVVHVTGVHTDPENLGRAAFGLPELVTHSFPEYQELATRLAVDVRMLARIRERSCYPGGGDLVEEQPLWILQAALGGVRKPSKPRFRGISCRGAVHPRPRKGGACP